MSALPAPYYQDDAVTIYHADALELLPLLPKVDSVITDPPYGVGLGSTAGSGGNHGLKLSAYASYEDSYENFCEMIVPRISASLALAEHGLVWTGPHIHEQQKPSVIGGVYCPSGSGRHSWGFKTFLPVLLYGSSPHLVNGNGAPIKTVIQSNQTLKRFEKIDHPCPKPIQWMLWSVRLASLEGQLILDPFMGSGTTLRAAKDLGRKAIGIELEEKYCEIAAKRMQQEVLPFNEPKQDAMEEYRQAEWEMPE